MSDKYEINSKHIEPYQNISTELKLKKKNYY